MANYGRCEIFVDGFEMNCPFCRVLVRSGEHHVCAVGDFPYVFAWDRVGGFLLGRKGQRCRVTARGKMNSCTVEFQDGYVMVTSRNALRKV